MARGRFHMNKPQYTLVTVDYPPARGGVARYLSELVRASDGGIEVIADTRRLFRSSWPRWWPMVAICREEGKKHRKIFVSHVFPVGTAAWISKMLGGPKYVVLFHGLDLRLVRGLWKQWLLRRICASATRLFANSDATASDLKQLIRNADVTVVTPGVDATIFPTREAARQALNISPDERVVLSVCRLVPRKGIDVALNAIARVQHRKPITYVVLGDGEDRGRLEKIAEASRTTVRWIRDAGDEEKRNWFSAADVFLLPVRDEGDDVEGFGIVFLEAAAAGIPSIAGRSGGAVEAVRHERTGLIVDPKDTATVEEAIERLLDDEPLCRRLGEEGRKRILADFRWEQRWDKVR